MTRPPRIPRAVATNFRQPPLRDKAYRASFNGQACIVCGSEYGVVGAHIREGWYGMGKPDDNLILPLCFTCHLKEGNTRGWFARNMNMDIERVKNLARQRYQEWKIERERMK